MSMRGHGCSAQYERRRFTKMKDTAVEGIRRIALSLLAFRLTFRSEEGTRPWCMMRHTFVLLAFCINHVIEAKAYIF